MGEPRRPFHLWKFRKEEVDEWVKSGGAKDRGEE